MKKGKSYIMPIVGLFLTTLLLAQGSGYLSQKLMVENNVRDRVKDALSKVIDSHKYVINVDVELEILDEVNEQITVFATCLHKSSYLFNVTHNASKTPRGFKGFQ